MVDVRSKRCSHGACLKRPSWGFVSEGTPTACGRHKSDLSGSPVINFMVPCKVVCCKKVSRWGIGGKQPTYCLVHGPLQAGLVRTVGVDSPQGSNSHNPSYGPIEGPSFRVKAECLF